MAAYTMLPLSLNGVTLVAGSIRMAWWDDNDPSPLTSPQPVSAVEATIPGLGDRDVRGQLKGTTWVLTIDLAAFDETDIQSLHATFNEQNGVVYLRCTDGAAAPKTWKIGVRQLGPAVRVTVSEFKITLRVADPRWQENVNAAVGAGTGSELGKTSSPINFTLTNIGNRQTRGLFTITANAAKSINSALNDYVATLQGFLVNRSPKDFSGPVYLGDQSGAAARFPTGTSAAGTTVQQTTGATTTTADPGAAGTSIAVTQLSGFNANGGLAILRWVTGSVFGTMECVSYSGKSAGSGAGNLTGVVRGLGGTTAQAHPIGATIGPCASMPNGDDCRVWLDDVPDVTRNVVAWNSTLSDVVLPNVALPAAPTLTLVAAMTAALPANGSSFTVNEDISRLPAKGFLVIDDEVIYFNSRAGRTVSGIQRAQWATTAAIHVIASKVLANPRHFVVAAGYAQATAPPAPLSLRPCTQLPGSNNQTKRWGDEADDPLTIYYDRNYPDRSDQWVPGFDLDGNTVSPLMSLNTALAAGSPPASGIPAGPTSMQFIDNVPGDGNPPVNFLEVAIPCGIKKGDANAVQNTIASAAEILNSEVWIRDSGGTLKLLDELQTGAAAANRVLPAVLGATAYALKLKGRYNIYTGVKGSNAYSVGITNASNGDHQTGCIDISFALAETVIIKKFMFGLAKSAAGTQDLAFTIFPDNGGFPAVSSLALMAGGAFKTITVSGTALALYSVTPRRGAVSKPGTYWCELGLVAPNATCVIFGTREASQITDLLAATAGAPPTYSNKGDDAPYFYVCSDYDNNGRAPVSPEQPVVIPVTGLRTGTVGSFDKTIVTIEPAQTVYVHRVAAFGTTLEHVSGVLTNTNAGRGETITYDKWMALTATLAVDCDARTVTYTEAGVAVPVTKACTFSNSADWMPLDPGANVLQYVDAALIAPGSLDLVSAYAGRKI